LKEQWIEYKPDEISADEYEVVKVLYDCNGTLVELEGNMYNLIIRFDYPDAVRICDEGRRIKTYNEAEGLQEYRKNFNGIPLYKVHHSEFYNWVVEESAGIDTDFVQYAIVTLNDIVDVISSSPPEIYVKNL